MRRNRALWLLAFAAVVFVVAGAVAAARRGFSARDQPSALETYVARTVRNMAVPSKAGKEKNPFPTSPELIAEVVALVFGFSLIAVAHGNQKHVMGTNTEEES